MIHVVIPAAGQGRRFTDAGYPPKPHVLVDGVPMLRRVVDNIRSMIGMRHQVTVVVQEMPPELADVEVVQLDAPTRGAVETILAAQVEWGPLLVANCDQLIEAEHLQLPWPADAWVAVFQSNAPHHSYVQIDDDGYVTKIAEKQVISDMAVVGLYVFGNGWQFRDAALAVLGRDERVLGEFYMSTVLAEMVDSGLKLRAFPVAATMLGTPEEVEAYHARIAA